jgi:hypothetical protein
MSGAGISAAQKLVDKDVQTVITERIGPNARDVLTAAGIKVVTGATSTVRETLNPYLNGKVHLSPVDSARSRGFRRGLGHNIGQGRALGMGRNYGRGSQRGQRMNQTATTTRVSILSMRQTPRRSAHAYACALRVQKRARSEPQSTGPSNPATVASTLKAS